MASDNVTSATPRMTKSIEVVLYKLPNAILRQQQFQKYILSPIYKYLHKLLLIGENGGYNNAGGLQRDQMGRSSFQNNFADSATTFKILAHLDNERYPLPIDAAKEQLPSLFEGFNATISTVKQKLLLGDVGEDMSSDKEEYILPRNINIDFVNKTYSSNNLTQLLRDVEANVENLSVQRTSGIDELTRLDSMINDLKSRRTKIFQKIKHIDNKSIAFEGDLALIKDRINFIKEYNLEAECREIAQKKSEEETFSDASFSTVNEEPILPPHDDETNDNRLKTSYKGPNEKRHLRNRKLNIITETHGRSSLAFRMTIPHGEHGNSITALDFDIPWGTLCSASYQDRIVKVWDLNHGVQVGELRGHLATVNCMQMDKTNYNILITGSKDATLKMWDLNLSKELYLDHSPLRQNMEETIITPCIHNFELHNDEITALSFDSEALISGSKDKKIFHWDLATGKCVQELNLIFTPTHNDTKTSTRSGKNGTYLLGTEAPMIGALQCYNSALATGTKDGVVRLWDLRIGKPVRSLEGHTDGITSLKFDSEKLVTGSMDNSVRIWDLRTSSIVDVIAYDLPVTSLDFDDKLITVGANERGVNIFNMERDEHWMTPEPPNSLKRDELSERIAIVKYKNGFLVNGHNNGDINVWTI
ncbi:Caf4p SKDI_11G2460 [Saccharomyces kudriavzevii IFO 1802]|uniref:CAF4-like protein n=2 Tax=Saccharomyces kudriavzevii (strain ATCC MYA-4449 / AS 2.2408 / CBS 8840 / NBRC 1802 / NCYC 2889) TaxID=226230 RepID=J8TXM6_SACK1|nr:uncharacterized protein SKDI_11G2460 [Saccharomyces kudriavzevii IFO 1802]EJT44853.1 CAF4-like protein [Saccharomyces kudriavzevii IFO 1802]CAI4045176.1 hypothetical protein SKDI_11G2460 [Saccharomyces kudriavzevii IFO 1802]